MKRAGNRKEPDKGKEEKRKKKKLANAEERREKRKINTRRKELRIKETICACGTG